MPDGPVALVHDYLTQRGGAERVALALTDAFPDAPLHTALFDPSRTFPELAHRDVRPLPLDRLALLRARHRLAMPLLAPAFSHLRLDTAVTVCSSSGWAHGARTTGRKVVYCYTPARWLYQTDRYLRGASPTARAAMAVLGPPLRRWDRAAAAGAHRYLAISTVVQRRIADTYGIEAEVVPPPTTLDLTGPVRPLDGVEPGFVLCVSRLLPYKNVDAVAAAFAALPDRRLVVVGSGPLRSRLASTSPANVHLAGEVDDDQLRWCYAHAVSLVAASYEDFGLTPLEAAAAGLPSAVLRWGGFLDTTVEGVTGLFFDQPTPAAVAGAVRALDGQRWDRAALAAHAARYSPAAFTARIRAVVADEAGRA